MGRTLQIRDLSEHAYSELRVRAAREDLSLSGYVRKQLEKMTAGPDMKAWLESALDRDWGVDRETALAAVREAKGGDPESGE
ncbi:MULTISPECIES: FitA-like ribbon-helix-helix domain-containing protein [Actinoalloteichus]|uniref:Antitoxin FitA-like ribbon-helix-helix domain-containing protein n=1 Tax=Actinoalloteichus fjordicus TaxID=1612552 RepID=A0AAC9LAX6_9PSEU|nr:MULTISPECIES: hypothetical protein [Actinoalloteichus]APU14221.1 hypothetical protein UA74_10805 [Actinoalloteichus fjordicus]APU20190.1 hypothetical protein UA75_10890 [Actinoalloteichus sp. GBA129-24]